MLQALLRGKLTREEENLEDLLTSNVFGSFKYLLPEEGLVSLLKSSVNEKGEFLLNESAIIKEAKYQFWPSINETKERGCEPDVLISILLGNQQKMILLVEAKYHSGKSSEAIQESESINKTLLLNDQLAVEWDNLVHLANREKAIPVLLYVTSDIYFPRKEIKDSCDEYKRCRCKYMNVFWISWRKLPTLFYNSDKKILVDLVKVLRKLGLKYFEGIEVGTPVKIFWSFKRINKWDWSDYKPIKISWVYPLITIFNWKVSIVNVNWRYRPNER